MIDTGHLFVDIYKYIYNESLRKFLYTLCIFILHNSFDKIKNCPQYWSIFKLTDYALNY